MLASLRTSYLRAELMHETYVTDADGRVRLQEPNAGAAGPGVLPGAREALRAGRPSATGAGERAERPGGVPLRPDPGLDGPGVRPGGRRDRSPRVAPAGVLRCARRREAAGSSIDVLDSSGVIIASTDKSRQGTASDHRQLLANLIRTGGSTRGTCHSCHEGSEPRTTDLMAFASARSLGWGVRVREPESVALADTTRLRTTLLALGPVLLGLGLLFAYGAAQSLLRPLGVLTRTAERIAGGDMEPPIPDLGADEVGRLGRSLEHMRATIKSLDADQIEEANARLERRVDERTAELEGPLRAARRARRGAQPAAPPGHHGPGRRAQAPGPRTARRDVPDHQRAQHAARDRRRAACPPGADSAPLAGGPRAGGPDPRRTAPPDLRPAPVGARRPRPLVGHPVVRRPAAQAAGRGRALRVHRRRAPAAADHGDRPVPGGAGSDQQHRQARGRGAGAHPVRLRAATCSRSRSRTTATASSRRR